MLASRPTSAPSSLLRPQLDGFVSSGAEALHANGHRVDALACGSALLASLPRLPLGSDAFVPPELYSGAVAAQARASPARPFTC